MSRDIKRILLRSAKPPHVVLSQEAAFARKRAGTYSGNAGNLLFTNAVYRLLNTPDAEVVSDSLTTERKGMTKAHIERINSEFDHFVLPLANSLRPSFKDGLARLTSVIEKLTIPVTVVGVGAQLPYSGDWSSIDAGIHQGVRRFAKAVLDRTASIGVRGEITKQYLEWLGFADQQVDVIGCPSMYDFGRSPRVEKHVESLTVDSKIAVNVDHRVPDSFRVLSQNYDRFHDAIFVSQNQQEAALLMWGEPIANYPEQLPGDIHHDVYRNGDIRFFQDPRRWIEFMETRDFVFGTRLHGTIAGLLAGTPSILLTHDSRTQELADYHQLPHLPLATNLDKLNAEELYDRTDLTPLNATRAENFDRYISFVERNGLEHIHQRGRANTAYAAQLASAPFSPALEPLTSSGPEILVSRMRWLWQGVEADQHRPNNAYEPPFTPPNIDPVSPHRIARVALNEHKETEKQVIKLGKRVRHLERLVAKQADTLEYLRTPIEKRLLGGIRVRISRILGHVARKR